MPTTPPLRRFALVAVLLLTTWPATALSQASRMSPDAPLGVIDTVIVGGNAKTRAYVILDEMSLRKGDTATFAAMEYDKNRIYGLGLFTRVDIAYDSLQGMRFLFVDVNERWYLIPYPIFGFRDGDVKRPFGGAGFLHNNVGGRNQKLYASLVFGSDPSAALSFSDPLIDPAHRLFFSGGLSFSRVRNKTQVDVQTTGPFDELNYDLNGTVGKRFTLSQTAGLNLGYHAIHVTSWYSGRTVSNDGTDRFPYATVFYGLDSRDLYEYASRGEYLSASLTKYGFGGSAFNVSRMFADMRMYRELPLGFIVASRLFGNLTWGGEVPTYAHVFFGYGDRLRGWFTTVIEGDDNVGYTLELRHYLFPPRYFRVNFVSLPPEFSILRFGIAAALFANTGTAWYRGDRLSWESLYSGYGGGLHFLLPYSLVVRVEYAWNQFHHGEFILDLRGSI